MNQALYAHMNNKRKKKSSLGANEKKQNNLPEPVGHSKDCAKGKVYSYAYLN
jgi:hypothetical protein